MTDDKAFLDEFAFEGQFVERTTDWYHNATDTALTTVERFNAGEAKYSCISGIEVRISNRSDSSRTCYVYAGSDLNFCECLRKAWLSHTRVVDTTVSTK